MLTCIVYMKVIGGYMKVIAYIYTDFPQKFGIPRQSGLVEDLKGKIVFEPEYRNAEAVRGLEDFNYIWLLWQFQDTERDGWSATVKPPRLGGRKRMGVFATRSPFRPNPIGLSSVKLERVELTDKGPVLYVAGVDLRDKTPIYDIKPYLPYADCHTDAKEGFAGAVKDYELEVVFPEALLNRLPVEKHKAIIEVLKQDPRPSAQSDKNKVYGVFFAGYNVKFMVENQTLIVNDVEAC